MYAIHGLTKKKRIDGQIPAEGILLPALGELNRRSATITHHVYPESKKEFAIFQEYFI